MPHAFSVALHGVTVPIITYINRSRGLAGYQFAVRVDHRTVGLVAHPDIRQNPDTDFDSRIPEMRQKYQISKQIFRPHVRVGQIFCLVPDINCIFKNKKN